MPESTNSQSMVSHGTYYPQVQPHSASNSNWVNFWASLLGIRQQDEYNTRQENMRREWEQYSMDKVNAYNDPASQMARYMAAGFTERQAMDIIAGVAPQGGQPMSAMTSNFSPMDSPITGLSSLGGLASQMAQLPYQVGVQDEQIKSSEQQRQLAEFAEQRSREEFFRNLKHLDITNDMGTANVLRAQMENDILSQQAPLIVKGYQMRFNELAFRLSPYQNVSKQTLHNYAYVALDTYLRRNSADNSNAKVDEILAQMDEELYKALGNDEEYRKARKLYEEYRVKANSNNEHERFLDSTIAFADSLVTGADGKKMTNWEVWKQMDMYGDFNDLLDSEVLYKANAKLFNNKEDFNEFVDLIFMTKWNSTLSDEIITEIACKTYQAKNGKQYQEISAIAELVGQVLGAVNPLAQRFNFRINRSRSQNNLNSTNHSSIRSDNNSRVTTSRVGQEVFDYDEDGRRVGTSYYGNGSRFDW